MMTRIKQWLAPPVFDNQKDNRTAYLLNIISFSYVIVLSIVTAIGVFQGDVTNMENNAYLDLAIRLLSFVVPFIMAQILMRRGRIKAAAYAYISLLWAAFVWDTWSHGGIEAASFSSFILAVIIAGLLVGTRGTMILAGLSILVGLVELIMQNQNVIVYQDISITERLAVLALNLILSGVYLSLYIRGLDEALSNAEAANNLLEENRENLENRVTQRTKDLELASEISRVLAQITHMSDLLQESVETIRTQFNFYYVQLYLTDSTASSLTLQAGTGNIGQELVRRGHRLVIGPGSINGVAAAEKRAVIVADTATNPLFRPNTFLPLTRSEMAMPLIIGERVVGVLDLQSAEPNEFSADNLPAFNALAGQLAVAIENAKLLDEAAAARAEVESFTRRITREGWSSYLDAVEHPRFLGFSFGEDTLTPLNSPLPQNLTERNIAQVPIDIVGEMVGAIQVEADSERFWTTEDLDLIQNVATQVGQQVEMLRSLDEAAQYRQEAERALRRVTHEAWLTYEESTNLADGFAYDQVEIKSVTAVPPADSPRIYHNLSIRGETIGELAVEKSEHVDENYANELVTAVASQLVTHMENLRLTEQTEKALANSQRRGHELGIINAVAEASADLSNVTDFLEAIQHQLEKAIPMNSFTTSTYEKADNTIIFEYAYDEKNGRLENSPPIQLQPYHLSYKTIHEAVPQIIHFTEEEIAEQRRNRPPNMMSEDASLMASLLFVPLVSGQEVVGIISTQSYDYNVYNQEHINLLTGVAGFVTTAIQKARLFEQTQARAEELAVINEVAQSVSRQIDRLELMQTVQTQVQRVMNIDTFFIAIYDSQTNLTEYPYIFDNGHIYQSSPEPLSRTSKVSKVLQTGAPILINRTSEEIEKLNVQQKESMLGDIEQVSASLLYIPLRTGQETLGVLSIQSYQLNAYDETNITLLSGIANHVAVALENNRLLAETRQAADREQILREISATINTSIDAESVLQTAAREIGRAIGVETYVYLTPDIAVTKSKVEASIDDKQNGNGTTP